MADFISYSQLRIHAGETCLVDSPGFTLRPGEIHVLVGASGSGKTLSARSLLGLVGATPGVTQSDLRIEADGQHYHPYEGSPSPRQLDRRFAPLRGSIIGYLPQDARASLNPVWRIGKQVSKASVLRGLDPDPLIWLKKAGFAAPEHVAQLYPHELSGGMAQRASIALVLARGSRFILADEPTTGLDPTIQALILAEMLALRDSGVGILFITHDLRIVPQIADHLMVMHDGCLVESSPHHSLNDLKSPAAQRLWAATSKIAGGAS